MTNSLLAALVPDVADRVVFCCGPEPFMRAVQAACSDLGVPLDKYHHESFNFDNLLAVEPDVAQTVAQAETASEVQEVASFTVSFAKSNRTVQVCGDEFVLKSAREAGLRLPASCTTGLCGTCKSKLLSGTVDMKHQGGIRQREIDAGFFLPCCSKPLSDLVLDR